jgi:cholesterol transport system auxiliary component
VSLTIAITVPPRRRTLRGRPLRALALALALPLALAGCLPGSPGDRTRIFAPQPAVAADPTWPQARFTLAVPLPEAGGAIDGNRIVVRPSPSVVQVYPAAAWADPAPALVRAALVHAFEDSGRLPAVARGGGADYALASELRAFEAVIDGDGLPVATVELRLRLVAPREGRIVASRRVRAEVVAADRGADAVAEAFRQALAEALPQAVGWTLATGNADVAARDAASREAAAR